MSTHWWEVRPNACVPNNTADRLRMHCTLWGMAGQEQRPTRASGAPVSQIRCERLAQINRQRQTIDAATLASDDHLACPPVDAAEFEVGHLGCPQPKAGQQREDGEIAQSGRLAPVAAIQ